MSVLLDTIGSLAILVSVAMHLRRAPPLATAGFKFRWRAPI